MAVHGFDDAERETLARGATEYHTKTIDINVLIRGIHDLGVPVK